MPWYNNFKPPRQLKRKVKEAFKQWVLCLALFCRVALVVMSLVLTLMHLQFWPACSGPFREDVNSRSITGNVYQIWAVPIFFDNSCFIQMIDYFSFSRPMRCKDLTLFYFRSFILFCRGCQRKMHSMQSISGLIHYRVIQKGSSDGCFRYRAKEIPF
jgi:hypothetical protein